MNIERITLTMSGVQMGQAYHWWPDYDHWPSYDVVRDSFERNGFSPEFCKAAGRKAQNMGIAGKQAILAFIVAEEAAYWASEKAKTRAAQQKVLHARRLKLRAAMRAGQRGRFAA